MARQDPQLYRAFQDYGAGKAKLYAQIPDEWVNQLYTLIQVGLQILGTDEEAVTSAFAWLRSGPEAGTPDGVTGSPERRIRDSVRAADEE
jgi:hypothetical protein